MKSLKKIVFLLIVVTLFAACRTKKIAQETTPSKISDTEFFCRQVVENEPQFTTANISKMGISIALNQQSFNLYGTMRMQTDSMISISLQPIFGMEFFRIELTPERIRVFDKIKRRYFESGYDFFTTISPIPVSFELFQDLFARKLFVLGRELKTNCYNDIFTLEKSNETFTLTSTSGDGKILHNIAVSPEHEIRNIDLTMFLEGSSIAISYDGTTSYKGVRFPENIALAFNSKQANAKLQLDISKAVFNTPVDLTPIELYRYERVTFRQLFNK